MQKARGCVEQDSRGAVVMTVVAPPAPAARGMVSEGGGALLQAKTENGLGRASKSSLSSESEVGIRAGPALGDHTACL